MRSRHLDLFKIVHDRRHDPAGRMRLEKLRILPQHALKHLLAQVGYGRKTYVIHKVIAEVIADSFNKECSEDGNGDHGPYVAHRGGHEVVQAHRMVEARNGE